MFRIHSVDDGRNVPIEYLPVSAMTPKFGTAMAMSSGKLALATGATRPQYISMVEKDAACTDGDIIPVIRVDSDIIFETTAQAALTSVNLGDKVTIHTDGAQVTATTASGVAEVVYMDGSAAGSMVRVRF